MKKKQLQIFENDHSQQTKLEFDGQFASWSLKVQKITELLQNQNLSSEMKDNWRKELHYYQDLLRKYHE